MGRTCEIYKTYDSCKNNAYFDSDGKENGEWSIIGIKPKKIIQSRDINNLDKTNNPFNNLKNIEKGFWMGWLSYEAGVYIEPKNPWHPEFLITDSDIAIFRDFIRHA